MSSRTRSDNDYLLYECLIKGVEKKFIGMAIYIKGGHTIVQSWLLYSGKFLRVLIFAIFTDHSVTAKIATAKINYHTYA